MLEIVNSDKFIAYLLEKYKPATIKPIFSNCLMPSVNLAVKKGALAGKTQSEKPLEESQASIRAARFAPSLSSTERYTLLRDGITRLYKAHIKIRQVKNILYLARALLDLPRRPEGNNPYVGWLMPTEIKTTGFNSNLFAGAWWNTVLMCLLCAMPILVMATLFVNPSRS